MAAKRRDGAAAGSGPVQQAIDSLRQFFAIAENDPAQYREILDAIPLDLLVRLKGLDTVLK